MSPLALVLRRAPATIPLSRRTFVSTIPAWQATQNATPVPVQPAIIVRMKADLKTAMKARDTMSSTVIRSVLAEVTNFEKTKAGSTLNEATVYGLIRRAAAKRNEAATQFRAASRADLAEKEESEITLLTAFLPPPLTNDEIERGLTEAVSSVVLSSSAGAPGAKGVNALVGKSLKAFWANVPTANAGEIGNEELTRRLKVLVEEQLL